MTATARPNPPQGMLPKQHPLTVDVKWESGRCRVSIHGCTPRLAYELKWRFERVIRQLHAEP